jgi:endonuclease/exonuclease/phosphatase family metal-dependent hydrolase
MKKFLLVTCIVVVLVAITVVGFLGWASRGRLSKEEYAAGFSRELPISPDAPGMSGGAPLDAKADRRFTIVTYNIGYCSGLTNNSGNNASEEEYAQNVRTILEALRKVNPDFVAMQEVDFASERSCYQDQSLLLAEGLGLKYQACDYTWDKDYVPWPYGTPSHNFGRMRSGQCVASRFLIRGHAKITMPKPEENPFWYNMFYLDHIIQIVEIDVASQPLVILSVHLEAYKRKTREQEAALVAQEVKKHADQPLILLGDFNARPPWQTQNETTLATILAVQGLHKEFPKEAYEGGDQVRYYTSSSGRPNKSIDHVFYNDKVKCLSARVLQDAGTGSDHLPVMMEFAFN